MWTNFLKKSSVAFKFHKSGISIAGDEISIT